MSDFVREYQVTHQIKLEENYRSYSNILDSANHLISNNKNRLGKNLRTQQGAGEPVRVYESLSDFAEAGWIVEEMKHLIREGQNGDGSQGVTRRHELAILYRSNAQSRVIETALFNAGIPYRVYGGLRFFERAEIKHALAYLRLLENPRDDTSFLRVVNFPPRGIGARSIEQLQDSAKAMGCCLHDAVSGVNGKAGANLAGFVAKLDVMREQSTNMSLRQIIEMLMVHSGLVEHYQAEREGQDRIENLQELVNAAESFVTQEGFGRDAIATEMPMTNSDTGETMSPLAAFLTHAALESGDNQAQAGEDAVQLMTVHASKGLEFDVVFITGMEEGLFPHENSMSDHEGLEEERRLMYVAITRARKRLYLSHSQTRMLHGQTRYNIKSRFLDELPEHALKWITPQRNAFSSDLMSRKQAWESASTSIFSAERLAQQPVSRNTAQLSGPNAWVKTGSQVFHTKFGEGTVLRIEGQGDDAKANIKFNRHGEKWLALAVAKLTPV
jgi:DNA helicase II / ATP-dependent DNA helicase PcrA